MISMKFFAVKLALSYLALASSYNLDTHNAAVFQDPHPSNERKSYFGYSVALYSSDNDSLVLIGAPRANSSRDEKREFIEPGVVYLCTTKSEKNCSEWPVEVMHAYWDKFRNYAWTGATIQVEKYRKPVAAVCSPRWLDYDYSFGICYSKKIETPATFYAQGQGNKHFFNNNDLLMTGFSLHIRPDNHELIVGSRNQVSVFNHGYNAHVPLKTYSGKDYDMNFGYSVTSGYFYNKKYGIYYATGMPRSSTMIGEVAIYGNVQQEVKSGSQVGEYFGFSLAACDLNSDGTDDLLVGAPLWSEDGDEGRIAIYLSKNQKGLIEEQSIRGKFPRGRFGSAIACLDDLDQDGYADVAVGAPYEEGHGAVYIFNGGPDGLTRQYQRIRGSELQSGVRGFGVSISGPRDVDGNGYVDVAVGAYLSGQAVLFNSRPVVALKLTKLALPVNFSLIDNSTQLVLDVCALYNGSFVSDTLKVNITLKFDNRVYVTEKSDNTYKTEKSIAINNETCISVKATLEPSNVLKPIEVDANISISNDPSCLNCPVINRKLSKLRDHLEVAFTLDCGKDNICVSDLVVEITSELGPNNVYVIGSKSNVSVEIQVWNLKEPAYDSYLYIDVPDPILVSRLSPECFEQFKLYGLLKIRCKIGNPLRNMIIVSIALDMSAIQHNDRTSRIDVKTETRSEEFYTTSNMGALEIFYYVNASVTISGKANESLLSYFEVEDTNVGSIAFAHVYEIQKFGVSPVTEVTFLLRVPTFWKGVKIAAIKEIECQVDDVLYKKAIGSTVTLINSTFGFKAENITLLSRENRTFYMNCTNKEIDCQSFLWTLGPFKKPQSSAKVAVKFELLLSKHIAAAIKGKDIIFVSEATVEITKPNKTMEALEKRPNYKQISTFFLHRPKPGSVAVWIIVLSALLGVALVMLATGILYKLGFFKRKRIGDARSLTNNSSINVTDEIESREF